MKGGEMSVNASVVVKDKDVDKALKILRKKLEKEGLWKYDPAERYRQGNPRKKQKRTISSPP